MERERLLIDTSILIDHLRKPHKDKTIFYQLTFHFDYLISSITEFEFSVGTTPRNRQFTEALLAQLPVLPFDSACVKTAAEIYRDLKTKKNTSLRRDGKQSTRIIKRAWKNCGTTS